MAEFDLTDLGFEKKENENSNENLVETQATEEQGLGSTIEKVEEEKPEAHDNEEEVVQDDKDPFDAFISELGYSDKESFLNGDAAKKLREYDNIQAELQKTREENENLYSKYSDIDNPFANDGLYKVNKLLKDNPDMDANVAFRLANSDIKEMDGLDVLILREKLENPELKDSQVKKLLERKYDIDDWGDIDDSVKDLIEIDAIKARKNVSKYTEGLEVPESLTPEEIREKLKSKEESKKASVEEIEKAWNPVMEKFNDAYNEIPIPVQDGDGVKSYGRYVLNQEDKDRAYEEVMKRIKQTGIKPSKEVFKTIDEMVYDITLRNNLPKLNKILVDKARNEAAEEYSKQKYNPSSPDGKKVVDKAAKGKKSLMDYR